MKKSAFLIAFIIVLTACEMNVVLVEPHEPVLHLEAVFYSGEPMPEMTLRQSFNGTGADIFEIPRDQLYMSGAQFTLRKNGILVTVTEIRPGIYRGPETDTIRMGDILDVSVVHRGRTIAAQANVPNYPVPNITLTSSVGGALTSDIFSLRNAQSAADTGRLWIASVQAAVAIPFVPVYSAVDIFTDYNEELAGKYRLFIDSGSPRFHRFSGKNFASVGRLSYAKTFELYFEFEDKPLGIRAIPFRLEYVIPEPFYETYYTIYASELVPVTVTNVTNGVGIFIGAIRYIRETEISVDFGN